MGNGVPSEPKEKASKTGLFVTFAAIAVPVGFIGYMLGATSNLNHSADEVIKADTVFGDVVRIARQQVSISKSICDDKKNDAYRSEENTFRAVYKTALDSSDMYEENYTGYEFIKEIAERRNILVTAMDYNFALYGEAEAAYAPLNVGGVKGVLAISDTAVLKDVQEGIMTALDDGEMKDAPFVIRRVDGDIVAQKILTRPGAFSVVPPDGIGFPAEFKVDYNLCL